MATGAAPVKANTQAAIEGFAPLIGPAPRLLILGTMPSIASLQTQQYYGHPRNAFWPIMTRLFSLPSAAPYAARVRQLTAQGVAVWDVLAQCHRQGSLDSAIETDGLVCNDFRAFLKQYPGIRRLYFNGAQAEQLFGRHAVPALSGLLPTRRLPSTSPANARLRFEQKLAAWRCIREDL